LETIEHWSERNGIEFQLALAWAVNGQLPTVRIGDRRMINSALLRRWLLTQKWTS
jgi:predicted site-specific integrase-resolvase